MTVLSGFADVETILIGFLGAQFPAPTRTLAVLPADLETKLPVIQVGRIGGSDGIPSIDDCLVDVECFAQTRIAAKALANQVRSVLRYQAVGYSALGASISKVLTSSGPAERPYGNPNLFRIGATYQITLHNHQ